MRNREAKSKHCAHKTNALFQHPTVFGSPQSPTKKQPRRIRRKKGKQALVAPGKKSPPWGVSRACHTSHVEELIRKLKDPSVDPEELLQVAHTLKERDHVAIMW